MKKIIGFISTYFEAEGNEELSLDYEMVLLEFKACLQACLEIICSTVVEEIVKLKTEGLPVTVTPVSIESLSTEATPHPITPGVSNQSIKSKKVTKNPDLGKKEESITPSPTKNAMVEKPVVEALVLEDGNYHQFNQVIKEKFQLLTSLIKDFYECMNQNFLKAKVDKNMIATQLNRSKVKQAMAELTKTFKQIKHN